MKKDSVVAKPAVKKLTVADLKKVTGGNATPHEAKAEDRAGNKAEAGQEL